MKELTEPLLEKLLDYYGNFSGDPRILSMVEGADKITGGTGAFRALSEDELDVAAAGDSAALPEKPERGQRDSRA
jgi:hypothetical protein